MKSKQMLFALLAILILLLAACRGDAVNDDAEVTDEGLRTAFEVNGHSIEAGANLSAASLLGADLSMADLRGINFSRADLTGATFQGADLEGADLSYAVVLGVNFTGANLEGINVEYALFDDATQWPLEYDPLTAGAVKTQ